MEPDSVAETHESSACAGSSDGGINRLDSTPHASGNAANQAGSSFSPLPEATTYEEQLSKMEGCGLAVVDEKLAIARLRDLNYYRLRGYWLTFERDGSFIEGRASTTSGRSTSSTVSFARGSGAR